MPSVSLTNPANGAYFLVSPTNILLQASASDSDGTITNVAFYNGTNLLGNVTASPYNFTWNNVNGSNYVLTAQASDNRGAVSTSSVVNITVNGALDFGSNNTNAYVTFGSNTSLDVRNFTLECWFKRTGAGIAAYSGTNSHDGIDGVHGIPLITKGVGENEVSTNNINYWLAIATNNLLAADIELYTNGDNHPIYGTTTISNGVWYHAAVTCNGTNLQLYLNGNLENTVGVGKLPFK